jgi:hypothetical protein
MAKLIVDFRYFTNAPKILSSYTSSVVCILIFQGLNDWRGGRGSIFGNNRIFLCVWVSRLALKSALIHTHWIQTKSAEGKIRVVVQLTFPVRFRFEVLDST